MYAVSISVAKAKFSELVSCAAEGESFIITKRGKPVAKVVAVDPVKLGGPRRIGFLAGHIATPEDFDSIGRNEIQDIFSNTGTQPVHPGEGRDPS